MAAAINLSYEKPMPGYQAKKYFPSCVSNISGTGV